MPPWKTIAPRGGPAHNVLRSCFFPQGKILWCFFLTLTRKRTGIVDHVFKFTSTQCSVGIGSIKFFNVKINRPVNFISKSRCDNFFDNFYLLNNMPSCCGFYIGRKSIKSCKSFVKVNGVALYDFHGLYLFQTRFFRYAILAFICVMLQVPSIGNITHIAHRVTQVLEISKHQIKGNKGAAIAEMHIAVDSRTTNIHTHMFVFNRHK